MQGGKVHRRERNRRLRIAHRGEIFWIKGGGGPRSPLQTPRERETTKIKSNQIKFEINQSPNLNKEGSGRNTENQQRNGINRGVKRREKGSYNNNGRRS